MASDPVIERFNVIEDISAGQITSFVDPFSDALFFQRTEERFGNRIPAVATSAHTWCQVVGPAETLPVVTTILATLDRMHDDHSQIQPALPSADIGDIGHLNLIDPANSKLSLYTIRRYD